MAKFSDLGKMLASKKPGLDLMNVLLLGYLQIHVSLIVNISVARECFIVHLSSDLSRN